MDTPRVKRLVQTAEGELVGLIMETERGTFFAQRKRVRKGSAQNMGREHVALARMMRENRAAGM